MKKRQPIQALTAQSVTAAEACSDCSLLLMSPHRAAARCAAARFGPSSERIAAMLEVA